MRPTALLRFGWRFLAFVVCTVSLWFCFEIENLLRGKKKRQEVINRWVPRWAGLNLRIYGVHVDTHGAYADQGKPYPGRAENGVGRIFVANHSSGMDIPIMLTIAEAHVISRHDLATWPLIGRSARRIGTLFVDRESRRSGASVLKEVDRALELGEGVAMFPEGTAHEGHQVHEFRTGAFNAARRAGAEIVPIGMAYSHPDAYYRKEPFMTHIMRMAALRRLDVAVEIGSPLSIDGHSPLEAKEVARQRVQELVDRARERLG